MTRRGQGAAALLLLATVVLQLQHVSAQWDGLMGATDYTPEYRAASVVTNVWLAVFATCSTVFGILGIIVAMQWPNPRVCCYKTPYSDLPSAGARSCCSLYSLNVGFAVFWILVFAIMAISRDVPRLVACLCFGLMHVLVVVAFRNNFRRHGRPTYATYSEAMDSANGPSSSTPAMGIPMHEIPMTTVIIGGPPQPPTGPPLASNPAAAVGVGGATAAGMPADAACNPYYHPVPGNTSPLPSEPPPQQYFTHYYHPGQGVPPPYAGAPYPAYPGPYMAYPLPPGAAPAAAGITGGPPGAVYFYPPPSPPPMGAMPMVAPAAAAGQPQPGSPAAGYGMPVPGPFAPAAAAEVAPHTAAAASSSSPVQPRPNRGKVVEEPAPEPPPVDPQATNNGSSSSRPTPGPGEAAAPGGTSGPSLL